MNNHRAELAIGFELLAAGALLLGPTTVVLSWTAVAAHAGAAVVLGLHSSVSRSQRALMAALTLTLPVLGVLVAVLTLQLRGRGEIAQFFTSRAPTVVPIRAADVSRLINGVSVCDALVSGDPDERSATLAMITRRPDAANLRLLRWAVARATPEMAVESALALEEMSTRFEERVAIGRARLAATPDFGSALQAADTLAEAIHTGLADECLFATLSTEALRCYDQAEALAPERLHEFAARKAVFARHFETES